MTNLKQANKELRVEFRKDIKDEFQEAVNRMGILEATIELLKNTKELTLNEITDDILGGNMDKEMLAYRMGIKCILGEVQNILESVECEVKNND